MSDTKGYLNHEEESGNVNISEDVIASIAGIATTEVEGVASLASGMNFAELLGGKKSMSKGVKIQLEGKDVVIDIFLVIHYGHVIPTVAAKVQDKVIAAVESMTGLNPTAVNVHITGVEFEKEPKKTAEPVQEA